MPSRFTCIARVTIALALWASSSAVSAQEVSPRPTVAPPTSPAAPAPQQLSPQAPAPAPQQPSPQAPVPAPQQLSPPAPAPLPPPAYGYAPIAQPSLAPTRAPERGYHRVAGGPLLSVYLPFEGYADKLQGTGFSGVLWVEGEHVAFDLRAGFAFDGGNRDKDWLNWPVEVGVYGKLTQGPVTPFIGAGTGLTFVHERIEVKKTTGTLLMTTSDRTIDDRLVALPLFVRAGALFFDSSTASLLLSVDYLYTVGDFTERGHTQALRVSLGAIFGGGR